MILREKTVALRKQELTIVGARILRWVFPDKPTVATSIYFRIVNQDFEIEGQQEDKIRGTMNSIPLRIMRATEEDGKGKERDSGYQCETNHNNIKEKHSKQLCTIDSDYHLESMRRSDSKSGSTLLRHWLYQRLRYEVQKKEQPSNKGASHAWLMDQKLFKEKIRDFNCGSLKNGFQKNKRLG